LLPAGDKESLPKVPPSPNKDEPEAAVIAPVKGIFVP
jgi:hypothetical protein